MLALIQLDICDILHEPLIQGDLKSHIQPATYVPETKSRGKVHRPPLCHDVADACASNIGTSQVYPEAACPLKIGNSHPLFPLELKDAARARSVLSMGGRSLDLILGGKVPKWHKANLGNQNPFYLRQSTLYFPRFRNPGTHAALWAQTPM